MTSEEFQQPVFSRAPKSQARKRHINVTFFVRLVLGRPRVCPGDFTGFVPGTNRVKPWDKPGFSPYFTQWKPGKPGFVPGTNPGLSLGQTWGRRAAQKVYVKKIYVPFSLAEISETGRATWLKQTISSQGPLLDKCLLAATFQGTP